MNMIVLHLFMYYRMNTIKSFRRQSFGFFFFFGQYYEPIFYSNSIECVTKMSNPVYLHGIWIFMFFHEPSYHQLGPKGFF